MKYLIVSMLVLGLVSTSCKKEGCTNPEASNYDEEADKDDGNCVFEGNLVFWYDHTAESIMQLYGITELNYIVGERRFGKFCSFRLCGYFGPCLWC